MTLPLLHRPIPFKDEAPGSFLLRTTEYNGWKSPSSLLIAHRYSYSNNSTINLESIMCDQKKWEEVLESLGITDNTAQVICYNRLGLSHRGNINLLGVSIPWNKLRLHVPAICPQCIAQNQYHKKIWDFKLITACSIHKVRLVDSCPKCKEKINWNRKYVSRCKCGKKFEAFTSESCDVDTTKYFESLIKNKDMTELNLLLSFHDAYEEFYSFTNTPINQSDLATLCIDSLKTPNKAIHAINQNLTTTTKTHGIHPRLSLYPLLSSKLSEIKSLAQACLKKHQYKPLKREYPCLEGKLGFMPTSHILGISPFLTKALIHNRLLESILSNPQQSHTSMVVTLESINILLHLCSKDSLRKYSRHQLKSIENLSHTYKYCHKFIDLMFNITSKKQDYSGIHVTMEGLKGILIKPVKPENSIEGKNRLTIKNVAQLCDVHYENIRFAIHSKILRRVPSHETKGTAIYIDHEDAHEFSRRFIFSGAIAKAYNCNPYNLAEKIFTTGVKAVSGPGIDGGLIYLFRRVDIDALDINYVKKIKNYPTKTGRKKSGYTPENDRSLSISKVSGLLSISIQKVLQLLRNGHLIESPHFYREKRITHESYLHIHNMQMNESLLPVLSAAYETGESIQQFRIRWLQTGFIDAINTGLNSYIFHKDLQKIKRFKALYISSREAEELINLNRSHIRTLKRQNKIKILKQLGRGKNKAFFYNRNEIMCVCNL